MSRDQINDRIGSSANVKLAPSRTLEGVHSEKVEIALAARLRVLVSAPRAAPPSIPRRRPTRWASGDAVQPDH
jgi:hypothetical protein